MLTTLTLGLVASVCAQACPVDDDAAVSSGTTVQDVQGEFVLWAMPILMLGLTAGLTIMLRSKQKESVASLNLSNGDEQPAFPDAVTIELSLLALEFDQVSAEKGVDDEVAALR